MGAGRLGGHSMIAETTRSFAGGKTPPGPTTAAAQAKAFARNGHTAAFTGPTPCGIGSSTRCAGGIGRGAGRLGGHSMTAPLCNGKRPVGARINDGGKDRKKEKK
jgi:hypothetical protein